MKIQSHLSSKRHEAGLEVVLSPSEDQNFFTFGLLAHKEGTPATVRQKAVWATQSLVSK
jgi:hypothetical protein